MGVPMRGCSLYAKPRISARLVEAEEPVGVQVLRPELAVQAFDKGIVCRFAGPAEVERDAAHEGPQIELLADEFRPAVDPDSLRIANLSAKERLNKVPTCG